MAKITLLLMMLVYASVAFAQNDFFIFKKRNKTLQLFKKDSYITFQLKDRQWHTGYITSVQNDSFYVTEIVIQNNFMGPDTSHFSGLQVALNDLYAMPRLKEELVYANGHVKIIYGKESFVYVKNGLIFQMLGGGYVLLNAANDIIRNKSPFANKGINRLATGAAVFLFGTLLHLTYRPTLRLGKKYHFEYVNLQRSGIMLHRN